MRIRVVVYHLRNLCVQFRICLVQICKVDWVHPFLFALWSWLKLDRCPSLLDLLIELRSHSSIDGIQVLEMKTVALVLVCHEWICLRAHSLPHLMQVLSIFRHEGREVSLLLNELVELVHVPDVLVVVSHSHLAPLHLHQLLIIDLLVRFFGTHTIFAASRVENGRFLACLSLRFPGLELRAILIKHFQLSGIKGEILELFFVRWAWDVDLHSAVSALREANLAMRSSDVDSVLVCLLREMSLLGWSRSFRSLWPFGLIRSGALHATSLACSIHGLSAK